MLTRRPELKYFKFLFSNPSFTVFFSSFKHQESDEVIEVTPKSIRLRKQLLDAGARERAARTKSKQIRSEKDAKK